MIDVIIPCFNAERTLQRAVQSVLNQPELGTLWIIDDGSTDNTFWVAENLARQAPQKIRVERMPKNGGAAKARNWGALQSQAEFIAFLDADDAYELNALQVAQAIFQYRQETLLVRLALKPIGLAEHYQQHPNYQQAWRTMEMTGAGNTIFQRAFFLACGGFPQHQLFRQFGGEDGALGIATTKISPVATAFNDAGVLHYCRAGTHAEYLLDAILFGKRRAGISEQDVAQAERVTEQICYRMNRLRDGLNSLNRGVCPIHLHWHNEFRTSDDV